ncbi:MAG: hypothetical protein ISP90_16435 [Nevskia sp.]|nr:hypothetical protein [Nevskia sp.]
MKTTVSAALLGAVLASACGATAVRPPQGEAADWRKLHVKVQTPERSDAGFLADEVRRTGLFGKVSRGPSNDASDLVISAIDEHPLGEVGGPFCLDYALAYLTAGIIPEVCDQRYEVVIDITAPATGRASQLRTELTQRRVVGLAGGVTSLFGDWRFFGPTPGDPTLARAALLNQREQVEALRGPR